MVDPTAAAAAGHVALSPPINVCVLDKRTELPIALDEGRTSSAFAR